MGDPDAGCRVLRVMPSVIMASVLKLNVIKLGVMVPHTILMTAHAITIPFGSMPLGQKTISPIPKFVFKMHFHFGSIIMT